MEVAGFAECTGLNIETKVLEYKEGGNNATTLKFPEPSTFGNVTLKRGVTNSNELIEWQLDVVSGAFSKNARANNPSVAIVLMNEKGEDVRRWNLIRAFPVKWIGPDLKASPARPPSRRSNSRTKGYSFRGARARAPRHRSSPYEQLVCHHRVTQTWRATGQRALQGFLRRVAQSPADEKVSPSMKPKVNSSSSA